MGEMLRKYGSEEVMRQRIRHWTPNVSEEYINLVIEKARKQLAQIEG